MTVETLQTRTRVNSIDLLRGIVIILMALDHVRDYFHWSAYHYDPLDLTQTDTAIYFTRWVTHFCAPVFSFLAGTSAFISGRKKTKKELASFLLTRGLWLVFLEAVIVTFGWTYNPGYSFIYLQVIWALGVSMIALAGLIFLPRVIIAIIGFVLLAGHNALDSIHVEGTSHKAMVWSMLHDAFKSFPVGEGHVLVVAYPVIAWIAIMALGYCFGTLYTEKIAGENRRKILISIGLSCILVFVILRWMNVYGNLWPWAKQTTPWLTFLSFMDVTKYPPSLAYALITLGPAILALAFIEKANGAFARSIMVYGRVPMFFYLIHIYFIHLIALISAQLMGLGWHAMIIKYPWISFSPDLQRGFGFPLIVVYLIWMAVVIALYPLCKKYYDYKSAHRAQWWLSYL